jgi:type IV pilus assembly protein PilC
MGQFLYRARDQRGELITGQIDAENLKAVQNMIAEQGLIPLTVKQSSSSPFKMPDFKQLLVRVNAEELIVFTRQFYTLFKSGMNMDLILQTLTKQAANEHLKAALQSIRNDVASGGSLASAFSKHEKIFLPVYTSLLSAGEQAGILEEVLKHMATLLEKEFSLKSGIKSATLYPKIVIGVMGISIYVLMTTVVPKFAKFYAHYDAALPLPTQLMMQFSYICSNYWYLLFGGIALGVLAYKRFARTPGGRLWLGQLSFKIPVFGDLELKVTNARFCHLLSALYRSGLNMPKALAIVASTVDNGAFSQDVRRVASDIGQGRSMSDSMVGCPYFSPILVEAISIGEKSGALDEMLLGIGEHYDLEVQHTIKNFTTLLEPILLIFIFGLVAMMALAIFLPIWQMSSVANG